MKKLLLLIFSCTFISLVQAQNWCPPGATWHFKQGFANSNSGIDGIIEMSVTGNATVMSIPCKRLDATFSGTDMSPIIVTRNHSTHYTYENNNVIFLYNGINAFDTLVNFNASVGDQWLKPRSAQTRCITRPLCTVTATSYININNFKLKKVAITYTAAVVGASGTFTYAATENLVERILIYQGINQSLFPTNCEGTDVLAEIPGIYFRCYEDNNFPLYYELAPFTSNWFGCTSLTGIKSLSEGIHGFVLSPNPADENVNIEVPNASQYHLRVIDVSGNIMNLPVSQNGSDQLKLELKDLAVGIYFIQVFDGNRLAGIEKLVKGR